MALSRFQIKANILFLTAAELLPVRDSLMIMGKWTTMVVSLAINMKLQNNLRSVKSTLVNQW